MRQLLAVAPDEPLAPRTFSGLSYNLFTEVVRQGISIDTIVSRDLRWHDVLRGALRWRSIGRPASRWNSRIDPDWYWSRRTHEQMTRRFLKKLNALPNCTHVLQIGTQVQAAGAGRRVFCLTDLTVVQAIETGGTTKSPRPRLGCAPKLLRGSVKYSIHVKEFLCFRSGPVEASLIATSRHRQRYSLLVPVPMCRRYSRHAPPTP